MKNLSKILALSLIFSFVFSLNAQTKNVETKKETIVKKYNIDKGDYTIPYVVTIKNKVMNPVKTEKDENHYENKNRIETEKMITKIITIDDKYNNKYDNQIELSYKSNTDNNFTISPSDEGFLILVSGREFKYSVEDKDYMLNKDDQFFRIYESTDSK